MSKILGKQNNRTCRAANSDLFLQRM